MINYITMVQEQPAIIDRTVVELILHNSQFFTKVRKFGILSQHLLLVYKAFLALRKRW